MIWLFAFLEDGIRKVKKSQERLDVHLQGRAGQRELKTVDNVGVEDSETPNALSVHKDLGTTAWEKGGIWKRKTDL